MKPLFLILFFSIAFISCTKTTDPNAAALKNTAWKWEKSVGGFAVQTITPATGTTVNLIFKSRSAYEVRVNGIMTCQGTFHIKNADTNSLLMLDNFTASGNLYIAPEALIDVSSGKLNLFDFSFSDGFNHTFSKVN